MPPRVYRIYGLARLAWLPLIQVALERHGERNVRFHLIIKQPYCTRISLAVKGWGIPRAAERGTRQTCAAPTDPASIRLVDSLSATRQVH